jgi:hypothetical protein
MIFRRLLAVMFAAITILATGGGSVAVGAVAAPTLSIPNQLSRAIALDKVNHTVTLPLYQGWAPRREVVA